MPGLQPSTRRLLTESAAAAVYRTAGQVTTEADTRATAAITAQKAQPSGLASLGADGKVPAGQLPPTAAPPLLSAIKAASTARASTATLTNDPDLVLTVATGTYWVELELSATNGSSAGAVALAGAFAGTCVFTTAASGGQLHTAAGTGTATLLAFSPTQGAAGVGMSVTTSATGVLRVSFLAVVTTAGTLAYQWAQGTSNASPMTVLAGARLRAQKVA